LSFERVELLRASPHTYTIRILLGSLFAVVVADGVITRFLVSNGLASEGNPLLGDWVYNDAFYTLKIGGALLAVMYLWSIYKRHPKICIAFCSLLLVVYTGIILWNLSIIWHVGVA
jgi:hypothetical protein